MADHSPMSIASLSLSPRRTAPQKNIFAAVNAGERWEPEFPPSPTEEEWARDFGDDDEDGLPVLPSPTRANSAAGQRNGHEDPFKVLAAAQRPLLKPTQNRLASAPNLFAPSNAGPKVRPQNAVPIVATSPDRRKSKIPNEMGGSPVRKGTTNFNLSKESKENGPSTGFKSKKGNEEMRKHAMRNNLQGRTLVELQQARGIPVSVPHAVSEDEGRKAMKRFPCSPEKPAQWNPEIDEMPSPFLCRTKARPGIAR